MEHMLGLNLQVLMNIVRKQKNHHSINTLYCNKLARRNIRCLQLGKFGPQSFIYKRNHSRDVVALGQGILITFVHVRPWSMTTVTMLLIHNRNVILRALYVLKSYFRSLNTSGRTLLSSSHKTCNITGKHNYPSDPHSNNFLDPRIYVYHYLCCTAQYQSISRSERLRR